MKLAVMGDIHGNHIALEACIAHALENKADEFIFIGDYVTDCPYPQKTMRIIYEMQRRYRCYFIRGNREDYMLNHRNNPQERWTYSSASGNLLYTYENLSEQDMDFFESIEIHGVYDKKNYRKFRYCHGSLTSSKELLLPDNENMESIMKGLDVDLLISGHTHIQESRMYGEKKLIHPGSVGVPWYYEGRSQYMILHSIEDVNHSFGWEEEFFQLPYDVGRVREEMKSSGLYEKAPYWAKLVTHALETGEDYTTPCLTMAMDLCREKEGKVQWPDIPVNYWDMAYTHFIH